MTGLTDISVSSCGTPDAAGRADRLGTPATAALRMLIGLPRIDHRPNARAETAAAYRVLRACADGDEPCTAAQLAAALEAGIRGLGYPHAALGQAVRSERPPDTWPIPLPPATSEGVS